ncbi:YfhJ family protein [Bacillus sp. FJAT-44742]|uniref:YfhJ family protein n=1 Tax=Bacillus sp. FJAT-44742 TaxID=2014005 RepID=UPI0018E28B95|nr:YfhJ family protein [Bacillus sp. FJAT-44742]
MKETYERLTNYLLEKNDNISSAQARTWVEHLWEDFETTRARAGRKYQGKEMTEQIVMKWLEQYGAYLHKYEATNQKFNHLTEDDHLKH